MVIVVRQPSASSRTGAASSSLVTKQLSSTAAALLPRRRSSVSQHRRPSRLMGWFGVEWNGPALLPRAGKMAPPHTTLRSLAVPHVVAG